MKKGVALLIILFLGMIGIGGVAWLLALAPVDVPKAPPKFAKEDETAIIAKVGTRSISRFHLNLNKELERIRVKQSDMMPDWGFLIRLMESAADEEVAGKFGAKIVEADLQREVARVNLETKEPDALQKMKDLCKPFPGMYEFHVIRTGYLTNHMIHNLHKYDRNIQAGPFKTYSEVFKKAKEDPSSLKGLGDEAKGVKYEKVDSRKVTGDIHMEPDLEQHKAQVMDFAKKYLGKTAVGSVCPDEIDDEWAYRVVRLEERGDDFVVYEIISVNKLRFDTWYDEQLKSLDIDVMDPDFKRDLKAKAVGNHVINAWLARKPN